MTRAYSGSDQESEDPNGDIVSLHVQEVLDKIVEGFSVKMNKVKVKNKKSLRIVSLMAFVKILPSRKTLEILLQMQN